MIWQHDPDFVDGNTISVFDNKGAGVAAGEPPASRIVVFSAKDDNVDVRYEGTKASPFFTEIMGKHQWLPNGNVLITETEGGRAFEVNAAGEIVWQYVNFVEPGVVGIVEEVTRLPLKLQRVFDRTDALASISAVHAVGGR